MPRAHTEEELAACGTANCGCWYAAEQGFPCQHDLELLASQIEVEEIRIDLEPSFEEACPDEHIPDKNEDSEDEDEDPTL
jgi:hypothetical protein